MMAFVAMQSWVRKGLQSHADLCLIAARTHTQISECHGQAVRAMVRNWPELGSLQPQALPKVFAGFVERQISYQQDLHAIVDGGQRALVDTTMRFVAQP